MIDLRSDTVTTPTPEMKKAIMEAEVGDDVYREDPTVNRLQKMAAEMLGKEDALLVTSGTQANQIALLTHCSPATEVIMEQNAHIFLYEAGAGAAIAGVQFKTLPGTKGALEPEQVEAAIRVDNIHFPPTSLICMENTHNKAGGTVIPLKKMQQVYDIGQRNGIPVYLDGARLFNASIASGISVKEYAGCATTVQICLSKGLAAPIGSILAGPADIIEKARRWRKRLGGGMRQAGIIAAPGIVALETMVERLKVDHDNAKLLAEGLTEIPGLEIDPAEVETNIVIVNLTSMTPDEFISRMKEKEVLVTNFGTHSVRMNTHKDVSDKDMKAVVAVVKEVLSY